MLTILLEDPTSIIETNYNYNILALLEARIIRLKTNRSNTIPDINIALAYSEHL